MGGTLDNGIYLPDQGERNCYNGLKNNWDTLDNLIETVQALSSAGLTREIVNSLPTENIKTNVIYMLRNSQQSGDLYDEYMYINNAWEPIGTSATEMDNYYTKSETNALPAVASGITASKVTGYDSHVANTEVHITAAERSTWNGKQNALDTDQTAAVNSGVNATKVTGYDTHVANTVIHVTSSDKTAWNGKQDGLSQTQLAAVNSGVTDTKVTGYDTHVADSSAHVSSADRTAWNGKQNALTQTQLDNIAAVPNKANAADLATVATTGDYGDLLNAPTIPTVNNATLTIQKNGTDVATFTANASSNVTANLSIPTDTSDLTNGAGFLTQHNPIDNELSVSSENAVQNKVVTTALNGKAASSHTHAAGDINTGTFNIARIPNLDASKITSGTIDIARLPKGSLERLVKVADQSARYALTTDDVQLGDTVQQLDTGVMYVVTDETKLDSADGYTEFTAGSATSVPWSGVTGKPSTFTPSSHTHGNISNDGKVGTTANKPLITGTGGAITAGAFGNQANTFCEGNDSRLSDARTPVAHTHTKSDITDLFNSANTWTYTNTYTVTGDVPIKITNNKDATNPSAVEMKDIRFLDVNGKIIGGIRHSLESDGTSKMHLYSRSFSSDGSSNSNHGLLIVNNKQTDVHEVQSESNFIPSANNSYDLGSSSYQWNNLYAKNYFYNGTQWGLDQANTWTDRQTFGAYLKSFGEARTDEWSTNSRTNAYLLSRRDTDDVSGFLVSTFRQNTEQGIAGHIYGWDILENSTRYSGLRFTADWDTTLNSGNGAYRVTLGTNTQGTNPCNDLHITQLKTINGINPGALSLPRGYTEEGADKHYINITSVIQTLDGTIYNYTMPDNGWICVRAEQAQLVHVTIQSWNFGQCISHPTGSTLIVSVPFRKNDQISLKVRAVTLQYARFYPMQGNV